MYEFYRMMSFDNFNSNSCESVKKDSQQYEA